MTVVFKVQRKLSSVHRGTTLGIRTLYVHGGTAETPLNLTSTLLQHPPKSERLVSFGTPQQNCPNQCSVLSHRMVIALSSTSSTSAGLHTGTRPPPSALCSKWSDGWRNGRSNTMEERDALWSTACECCGAGVMDE